ncbi:outer membrane beta-barrel domain-containing protein [Saccharobesus litoralis]|uniref:Outer membrane beta-barrel domain-containing protein n=1 Tax=Saccharobesus litoralis TaxID=2172099 RepID=A0A2S0VT13_9ALTE|nr:outer membrane beta-barrel domain-containing protein [Saccharobesus litoralis]AWB67356.1 outer membrane beta-barrel domain-containing protein [Saccharobesus litoralis]
MENRLQRILLTAICSVLPLFSLATQANERAGLDDDVPVKPNVERRQILEDKLDNENFEFGLQAGALSIEDFGTSGMLGAHFSYHMTEFFYLKAKALSASAGKTSFERLVPSSPLLTDSQRELTHIGLNVGYNLMPGETFIGKNLAFNNVFSIELGAGTTEFAGDDKFTMNFAANYRVFFTDWITWDLTMADMIFDTQVTGESKTTHNLSFATGVAFYF